MPIDFFPRVGSVLMCDFGPDPRDILPPGVMRGPLSVLPEIFKTRHVVVIQARSKDTSVVVPFSTVRPRRVERFHYCLPTGKYPFLNRQENWVKADLLTCVSCERLERVLVAGRYSHTFLDDEDVAKVQQCVLRVFGLGA